MVDLVSLFWVMQKSYSALEVRTLYSKVQLSVHAPAVPL